jgi:uncharacterized protein YyaL (SSP411 family)
MQRFMVPVMVLWIINSVGGDKAMSQKSESHIGAGHSNQLIHEKSPYLLQHADNPVDWYPWGEEAFQRAKAEDKPIFLSVGYSTCHWCHVMAHESFEDAEVAALMNEAFVSIKVDREERPDIDSTYMMVCQMMTGSGGWPLTIIMTPEKKPFFAATYIPKATRYGRIGMLDLIPRITEVWKQRRDEVVKSAEEVTRSLEQISQGTTGEALDASTLHLAYKQLADRFDASHGGFGAAPKFPTPHHFLFLLRYFIRMDHGQALEMVEKTLAAMRLGGIYDHVGFGFHRYSTDAVWLLPHFEKMLYDQALLSMAYTEAYLLTKKELYGRTAQEIFSYVLRDMTAPVGGFYSAEDADSEGEEGKFYLWTEDEICRVLPEEEAKLVMELYDVDKEGNFAEEATGMRTGANILHLKKPPEELADALKISKEELLGRLETVRKILFESRERRVHPHKDDKVLTDWNGLMIAALAKGAQAFDEPKYAEAAGRAVDFILNHMRRDDGRLLHSYRDGRAAVPALADDYAFLIWGLLELYEATFEVRYLQTALDLDGEMLSHLWDEKNGGFYATADDAELVLVRQKEIYDGAVPAGNSVAMWNLLRMGRITGNIEMEERAMRIGKAFSGMVRQGPSNFTQLMVALDFWVGPHREVVISGDPKGEDTRAMIRALMRRFVPNKVVLLRPDGEEDRAIVRIAPFAAEQTSLDGRATAYVCENYACKLPTTDVEEMLALLGIERKE